MKLLVPPIDIVEDDGFANDIDIFERKPYGEALLSLIQNTDDELVLALDAPWGEGKSTFIKMWQGLLLENNVPNIYFDSFEHDYHSDPFISISAHIYSLIDEDDEDNLSEFKEKATSAIKLFGRAGLRIGIKAMTAGLLDESVLENTGNVKDASKEVSDLVDGYISAQISKADEDRKTIDLFKKYLSDLGGSLGGSEKIIIIIDELDRCKPKFALALLESIKHLFSVPNITFILVTNREQLEESVRCEYGRGVNASKYLQKFVSIWTTLPKPNDDYASVPKLYLQDCLARMEYKSDGTTQKNTIEFFEYLVSYYNLSLRDIEKSLTSFAILNNTIGKLNIEYSFVSVFLAVTKATRPCVYQKLANNAIEYEELEIEASLAKLGIEYSEQHPFKWLLKYLLATNDEAEGLLKQGNPFAGGISGMTGRNAIKDICRWLESFQKN